MSTLETSANDKVFLSIVQGTLRQAVPEGTKDAIRREWEAGGEKGVKHELVFRSIVGKITDISFFDGEAGGRKFQNLNIVLDENDAGKKPVISIGTGTRYGQDLMKKLPSVDFTEDVKIRPFSFIPEGEDKEVTGVEILQRDGIGQFTKKVKNFFYDEKEKKNTHGFPEPEGDKDTYDSEDWKVYFINVKKFLVNYTKEHISTRFHEQEELSEPMKRESDIRPEDIPF